MNPELPPNAPLPQIGAAGTSPKKGRSILARESLIELGLFGVAAVWALGSAAIGASDDQVFFAGVGWGFAVAAHALSLLVRAFTSFLDTRWKDSVQYIFCCFALPLVFCGVGGTFGSSLMTYVYQNQAYDEPAADADYLPADY